MQCNTGIVVLVWPAVLLMLVGFNMSFLGGTKKVWWQRTLLNILETLSEMISKESLTLLTVSQLQ